MYLCRAAWQKLAPVARNSGTAALLRNAPARQMSSSSVPGSSGSSLPYTIFVCASLTAGGLYVYHTLTRDQARFQDRHEYIRSRPKPETAAKPWPPQGSGEAESSDVSEAPEEAAVTAEAVAIAVEEIEVQETIPTALLIEEDTFPEEVPIATEPAAQLEAIPPQGEEAESSNVATEEVIVAVTVEAIAAEESEIQDTIHAAPLVTEEMLEDVAVSEEPTTELQTAPVSEQNTGTMAAASAEESSPVLEETSGNIQEELAAAAADDWSELSSHKPEEAGEEAVQATTESLEVAQTEEVSASS
uniref:Mitochondria localized glutamic acid-rich protein n=1 Tax=Xenopus tropicalis TaxID=8364 RepID=A0A6I8RD91_XENTR